MPDQLNKQSLVNLLIDSPLREPIKINLIDIVNNTTEPDLPKVFPTIVKELEIFQKATERRMKLAEETVAKLGGTAPQGGEKATPTPATTATSPTPNNLPPLDLPPLPPTPPASTSPTPAPLAVPPLDLPPMPTAPTPQAPAAAVPSPLPTESPAQAPLPTPAPLGGAPATPQGDEAALAEIQKELDSLKTETAQEVASAAAPAPAAPPTPQA